MFHAKSAEITAQANTTVFMRVMDVRAFSSAQFDAIVSMFANRNPMVCVKLIKLIAINVERVD
jgi:hypothetical protein